jgi:hypothetical protein
MGECAAVMLWLTIHARHREECKRRGDPSFFISIACFQQKVWIAALISFARNDG